MAVGIQVATLVAIVGGLLGLNNNLKAILGYTDMILSQIGDDKPISADLREVQRTAERAAGLVRRLLAFGRRQVFQPRSLDLNEVIAGLRPMLERLIVIVFDADFAGMSLLPANGHAIRALSLVCLAAASDLQEICPRKHAAPVDGCNGGDV